MVGMGKPGHFGPMVIGEEQAEVEKVIAAKGQDTYGAAVTGDLDLGPKTPAAAGGDTSAPVSVELPANLDEFRKQLFAADQRTADGLLVAELAREDGPRKTALSMLLEAEEARATPRPEWLKTIGDALAKVT